MRTLTRPELTAALAARLDGFTRDDLEAALSARSVVKTTIMRLTLHLDEAQVTAELGAWLREPRTNEQIRERVWAYEGVTGEMWTPVIFAPVLLPLVQLPPAGHWKDSRRPASRTPARTRSRGSRTTKAAPGAASSPCIGRSPSELEPTSQSWRVAAHFGLRRPAREDRSARTPMPPGRRPAPSPASARTRRRAARASA